MLSSRNDSVVPPDGSVDYYHSLTLFEKLHTLPDGSIDALTNSLTPQNYLQFISANASDFGVFKLTLSWAHDTRNKAFFPDSGLLQSLSASAALPGSDVD